MVPCVRFLPTVTIVPSPGGVVILSALAYCAEMVNHDLTVTSGSDGDHSGPDDPHYKGDAYDIRIHDLPDQSTKDKVLKFLTSYLGVRFYAFIEAPGTDNEHIHCQVAKGVPYP